MKRILLGFGNCVDYEVHITAEDMERLILEFNISAKEIQGNIMIASERSLAVSILSFLKESRGGECWVENGNELLEKFASRFEKKITIGGNAARAGIAMHKAGCRPTMHLVSMNPLIRSMLPQDCSYIYDPEDSSLYPHLIIQFDAGLKIQEKDIVIVTRNSNRVIYVDDTANAELRIAPQTAEAARNMDVLMVSGLNGIHDREVLRERLNLLASIIAGMPEGAEVFYEESSLSVTPYYPDIAEKLKGLITLYSLNEDEMQEHLRRNVELLGVKDMTDALNELYRKLGAKTLILHTKWYALAYGCRASSCEAALKAGVDMAGTRYRLGDDYGPAEIQETSRIPPYHQSREFAEKISKSLGERICCVPSHELRVKHATTIGLGDSFVGGFLTQVP